MSQAIPGARLILCTVILLVTVHLLNLGASFMTTSIFRPSFEGGAEGRREKVHNGGLSHTPHSGSVCFEDDFCSSHLLSHHNFFPLQMLFLPHFEV